MWINVLLFLVGVATFAYWYVTKNFGTLKAMGIHEHEPSFPFGCPEVGEMMMGKRALVRLLEPIYQKNKDKKVVAYFTFNKPYLVLNDLDLVKQVFVKDFDHFVDRRQFTFGETKGVAKYFKNMLLMLNGDKWKQMRNIVSPIFTSGKLKTMSKLSQGVATQFVEHIGDKYAASGEEFNARTILYLFTTQNIACTGFGIDANMFEGKEGERFRAMVKKATGQDVGPLMMLKFIVAIMMPAVSKALRFKLVDEESTMFFVNIIKQTIQQRKGQSAAQRRNDMVDLLMDAFSGTEGRSEEVQKQIEDELDIAKPADGDSKDAFANLSGEEIEMLIVSNLLILFLAGLDTSSAILAASVYFLCKEDEVQERLYNEIADAVEASGTEQLDYNTLQNLPYLDMVINETIRHYSLTDLERLCVKDYKLPGTNYTVPKGMLVQTSASGIMMDERYFPNPQQFTPENFSAENKAARNPYAFMGFGFGPRNCIGSRMALIQLKICISRMVYKYKLLPGKKMPEKLEVDPKSVNTDAIGGIWATIEERN